jgi:hypothetical protein
MWLPSEKAYFGALCAIMLCAILAAGLTPFGSPENGVRRLPGENGLAWTGYSIAVGDGPLLRHPPKDPSFTIELRLRPGEVNRTRTLIAFYDQQYPRWFRIRQTDAAADLTSADGEDITFFETKDFFEKGQSVHLTFTGGPHGARFYANGELVSDHPSAKVSSEILTGTITLGNSATQHDSWRGEILGLAIFHRELAAGAVARHFQTWNYRGRPEIGADERPVALYLFDEGSGRLLRNQIKPDTSLNIPQKYELSRPVFLALPWHEVSAEWSYVRDVLINLAGFVPFGFLLRSYFSHTSAKAWSSVIAMLVGVAVSLVIELTQSHLPTRDSSLTDVTTNSLGNWAGVMIAARYFEKT